MNNEFPKEFSINLDEFLQKSEKLEFSRIESLEDTHPIQSDDVYTLNQDGNVVKVNLASQIQVWFIKIFKLKTKLIWKSENY